MKKREQPPFTSALTKREAAAVLVYFPIHIVLLPLALGLVLASGAVSDSAANLMSYAVGAAYMLVFAGRFMRRDFDPLCDHPWRTITEILAAYGLMLCFNILLGFVLSAFAAAENPNNQAVTSLALADYGPMAAAAVFLAPIVEELLFRAGVFGLLRRRSRIAAYAASMLLFSLYHVWNYAIADPRYWIYLVQYLPVSYLLCRCYERTDTIWGSIFLHMLINGISMRALMYLQEMM